MDERTLQAIRDAVEDAFGAGVKEKRYIDVSRIPLICQAIVSLDKRMEGVESNIIWGVRVVIGAVILALLALVLTNS